MKYFRWGFLFCASAAVLCGVRADDIKNNFQANLNQSAMDALAKDLGAIVGGGSFHQGKALGFPLGFDVGAHMSVAGIKKEDVILRDDGSTSDAVFGQVEVGLPARLNVIGRAGSLGDSTVIGGGLRWGVMKSAVPGVPNISIQGLYDQMSHDFFDMKHIAADVVLSFDIPIIRPYIGAGWDNTKLELKSAAFNGGPPTTGDGSASGYRVEGGINLSLIPFTYLTLGAGIANSEALYHAGLGLIF